MSQSWYHSLLRVTLVVVAFAMVFESGVIHHATRDIAYTAGQQIASVVGMTASIAPNELNIITAQLTEKEQQLALREASLIEREIAVSVGGGSTASSTTTFLLATILFVLLLLIVLNYILDYLRSKEREFLTRVS
jgi:hypothetical protein